MATTGRFFPVQVMHLGPTGAVASFNQQTLGGSGDPASGGSGPWAGNLGQLFEQNGKVYRLVQFDNGTGNVASAAGGAAHWKTRASFIVTSDQTDAEATVSGVAGGFLGVVTDLYYCFIQCGGVQNVITDGTADAGDLAQATATDLTFAGVTDPVQIIFGVFYTADGSGTTADMYWLLGNMI